MKLGIAATLLLLSALTAHAEWSIVDMNRHIDETNFTVNRGCSGTLIDIARRYVLTANHCVEDQWETFEREKVDPETGVVTREKVRRLQDGTATQLDFSGSEVIRTLVYKVRLIKVDRDRDLALLQIVAPIPQKLYARLACVAPVRGEHVYAVGNPMGELYSSVTVGIVSSVQRDYHLLGVPSSDDRQPLIQISPGIVGGNSGGAVYNDRGELVGVPLLASRANEVLGFAAPLGSLREFLKDHIDASCSAGGVQ